MSDVSFSCNLNDLIANGVYDIIINAPFRFSQFIGYFSIQSRVFYAGVRDISVGFNREGYFTVINGVNNDSLGEFLNNANKEFFSDFNEFNDSYARFVNDGFFYNFKKQRVKDKIIIDNFFNKKVDYIKRVVPKVIDYFFDSFLSKTKEVFTKFGNEIDLVEFNEFFTPNIKPEANDIITALLVGSLSNGYFLEVKENCLLLSELPSSIYKQSNNAYRLGLNSTGLGENKNTFKESWINDEKKGLLFRKMIRSYLS